MVLDILQDHIIFQKSQFSLITPVLLCIATYLIWMSLSIHWKKRSKDLWPPGPVGLPIVGYLPFLGKEPHKSLWRMKEKYGDIIGLYMGTKYTVVLNEYNVMKETFTQPGSLDRAPNLFEHIPLVGFIAANGDEWQEQRRFCLSSARDLGLGRGTWENIIMEEVSSFSETLQKTQGAPVEISHALSSSISSNIISLLIGRRLRKEEEADKVQLSVEFSDVSFSYMGPSNAVSLVPGLRKVFEFFKIAGYDKAAHVIKSFCNFVKEEVSRHKTSPEFQDVHDFINSYLEKQSKMMTSEKVKHYFSERNLEGNVNILFLAASDTIFSSLGWLLRLMSKHKDIQQKVYTELMEVLGKDGIARYEERNKIPYTFAVMMEAQRYSSIVPLSTTRRANQDFQIRGFTIPKGAEIVANLWALHYDPNYWEEPEKFRPERFLADDNSTLIKQPKSYAPFSFGRRNCPGETIAWMEILAYFSELIKRFEISSPPGVEPQFIIINGLVEHLKPQSLCFKERNTQN